MKDSVTPVQPEEVREVIKKCLETAALINYSKLSSEAKVEGKSDGSSKTRKPTEGKHEVDTK